MDSRRDFLKKAALAAAGGGLAGMFPPAIMKALAIDPAPGSTYLDAEHVVILMQENRSFDHCYGTLRGVRGFSDPRAVTLPDGNPVWLQSNRAGQTYAPFRLNIQDTKATWMGSLPHSWTDQVDAFNGGRQDGWLEAKPSGHSEYAGMPLTMGYFNRADIPFYYALADAFTVCDQNFCSSLTGTTPNRLHLWTGTIREKQDPKVKANVFNSDVDYGREAGWKTFPERLEENGVSWRVYQNEISLASGFAGEEDAWLSNFTDNPLEWFRQYHVNFAATHRAHLQELAKSKQGAEREQILRELAATTPEEFAKLPERERNLHQKAFSTNKADPNYRTLAPLDYQDGATKRQMLAPKGDVLHQFRQDVRTGQLPTVSWIVAPENFSDHPGAPWYGAWYLSEVFDILTKNAEVWRKTIFILCYDENDGYFDHVPPFVPPHPSKPGVGKASEGIDTSVEHVFKEQEAALMRRRTDADARTGPIGLGFRVPLVIASPWSRGGFVNSEVCDHTSILRLLEQIVSRKAGREIQETNISKWRRQMCGNLASVFRPYHGEKIELPKTLNREAFLGQIHQAQFKGLPSGFKALGTAEIQQARENPAKSTVVPRQEKGPRPACALPYELAVDGQLSADRKTFELQFESARELFGDRSAGAPFHVYAPGRTRTVGGREERYENGRTWAYAVAAGTKVRDQFAVGDFEGGRHHLRVHGPNGFYRSFRAGQEPLRLNMTFRSEPQGSKPMAVITLQNLEQRALTVTIEDASYGGAARTLQLAASNAGERIALDLEKSYGWYDVRVTVAGVAGFEQRYAGRVETGRESMSDPLLERA